MFKILGKNGLRTSAFALACFALAGMDVKATPMKASTVSETYSTTASIMTDGITHGNSADTTNPIGFTQRTKDSFGLNSNVSLGSFAVSTLADGSSTTYNHTPFTITYNPVGVGDSTTSSPFTNKTAVTLKGWLDGTVDGSTSSVVATFDPNQSKGLAFQTVDGTYISTLSIANSPLSLVPSTSGDGQTSIQALVTTTASPLGSSNTTPEPTTLAILGTAIVGLGLRQRLRKGRQIV